MNKIRKSEYQVLFFSFHAKVINNEQVVGIELAEYVLK